MSGFIKTIDWYNKHAKEYAQTLSGRPRMENIELFVSFLPKGGKVLDAGCAGGRDSHIFAEKGFEVTGVDISQGLIEVAQKTYPEITFVQGSFLSLPFANDTFDGIWSQASLVHLETVTDVKKSLSEFERVLKKNGMLYVYVKEQLGKEKTAFKKDAFSDEERFFQYFTEQEMTGFLKDAGFDVLHTGKQADLSGRPGVSWILLIGRKK